MQEEKPYKYFSNGNGWAVELFTMFVSGFLVATLFWVALWYLQARPAHAQALSVQVTEVEQLEARLQECTQAQAASRQAADALEVQKADLNKKLEEARRGWGRCLRQGQTE